MSQELFLNGVDADTGGYLTEGMTTEMIARVARGQTLDPNDLKDIKLRKSLDQSRTGHYGVTEGIDPAKLEEAGWSVIFPADLPQKSLDAIKEALKPLLDLRKSQAASVNEIFYKEVSGVDGYKNGESKNDFLKRFGRGPGPADPEKFPYYAMIVGSPETIPYSFQYQLDVQYGVGRIYFDRLEDYYNYATSVVQVETRKLARARKAAFFGVANADDKATQMSAGSLIKPLSQMMQAEYKDWGVDLVSPDKATKSTLAGYMGGDKTPAILFTASHGMNFKTGDERQMRHQGALITAEWPGPKARAPITDEFYFSGDDLPSDADLLGMFAFVFACYGGGTPRMDNFYRQAFGEPKEIAPYAFLAPLPVKLLAHPRGGALGVFAHVERAWGSSIMWDGAVRDVETFNATLQSLLNGKPAGHATEYFNERYAEISSDLTTELDETTPETQDDIKIAGMWTSNNDSRNYAFLGDPAVRLAVEGDETPKPERQDLGAMVTKYPAGVTALAAGFQPDVVEHASVARAASAGPADNYGIGDFLRKESSGAEGGVPAAPSATSQALRDFVDKVGKYMSQALDDATSLEISTYTSPDLTQVAYAGGKFTGGAALRAMTRIAIDGDTLVCVPTDEDGEVDAAVWQIHLDMVQQAQASRAELIKTVVSAASSIANVVK
jgi:hypothetical protein